MSLAHPELAPSMVCAIVIAYEPDDCSIACIQTVAAGAAHTLIFDNASSEERRQKLRALAGPAVTLVEHPENVGVAAGFNRAIRLAAARGYRWFVLFDQDSRIEPTTIPQLARVYSDCRARLGSRLGFLGCTYQSTLEDGTVLGETAGMSGGNGWQETELMITSGTLISDDSFEAIGDFREDFFIDHVDHDYCLRARRLGYTLVLTSSPLMVHRLGALRFRRPWQALGNRKLLNYYSPLRRYYQVRNLLVLAREYEKEFPANIAALRRGSKREISRALKYEGHFFTILRYVFLARRDSRRGLLGKFDPARKAL